MDEKLARLFKVSKPSVKEWGKFERVYH